MSNFAVITENNHDARTISYFSSSAIQMQSVDGDTVLTPIHQSTELEQEYWDSRQAVPGVSATCPQLVGGVALGQWLHRGDGLWRYHA